MFMENPTMNAMLDSPGLRPTAPHLTDEDRRVRLIRCWPPFHSLNVEWIHVVPAAEASDILAWLGLSAAELWHVERMVATDSTLSMATGVSPDLQGTPCVILMWEGGQPQTGALNKQAMLVVNHKWAQVQLEAKALVEQAAAIVNVWPPPA